MRAAFLFPGQGSQKVGMGLELAAAHPAARAALEEADAALPGLLELIEKGPPEELQRTRNTQPALLAVSVATFRALAAAGAPGPAFFAGHSLGEWSALVAAGSLPLADALRAVRARGEFMQQAVPEGEGAMAAVLGAPFEVVRDACAEIERERPGRTVQPANHNAPDQTAISGHADAVEAAGALCKTRGARRALKLPVSAPFHCRLMTPVQPRLAEVLQGIALKTPSAPVVTNVTAEGCSEAARFPALLVEQVVSTVRWVDSLRWMEHAGVDLFVELGPGEVLSGLCQRALPGARALSVPDPAGLKEALAALS
jgi:[acyl-carrier-protein] S-malonyltransferase